MSAPARIVAEPLDAVVTISVADTALARALSDAIARTLRAGLALDVGRRERAVRLSTRKRLAALGPDRIAGAIVVVRVTETNGRRLAEIIGAARAAGAAGVQLVWDGVTPAPARVERHVFAALEEARATPAGPPVVLSIDEEPTLALRLLIRHRERRET